MDEENGYEDGSWDEHSCYVERCEFCEKIDCECD